LSTFLIETNFDKLVLQDSNGQFSLNLIFQYTPHFKTSSSLTISDFPAGKVYTINLNSKDGIKPLNDNSALQILLNRKGSYGLVACFHPDYQDSIILVPSDRLGDLKRTNIQLGYKYQGRVYRGIFVCDNQGTRLISMLDFSDQGITVRSGFNWVENFYEYEPSFENDILIGYQSNFYAAYMFATGRDFFAVLQDTTVLLEHMNSYKDPLHQLVSESVATRLNSLPDYKPPSFITFKDLAPEAKTELIEVLSLVNQFANFKISSQKYKYDAISDAIISQAFFDKDINLIKSLLDDMSPSLDELSDLSYSRQKLLYHTIHELFKGYSGSNDLINDYNRDFKKITFGEDPSHPDATISSNLYTQNEFKAVEMIEEILPKLFGYRFVAALKLGMISFFEANGEIDFEPVAFTRYLCQEMLNARKVKAINALDIKPYSHSIITFVGSIEAILISHFVFGHTTTYDVIDKGIRTLSMFAADYNLFISELTGDDFRQPYNPLTRSKDYGTLTNLLQEAYDGLLLPDLTIRNNIRGKTALMNGFAKLFQTQFSSLFIRNLGISARMNSLLDNADSVSKSSINYAVLKTFEYLINPKRFIDPTGVFRSVYRGVTQLSSFLIEPEHGWATIWSDRGLGRITLDYATIAQYFGRDFSTIQPALYYTERNLQDGTSHVGYGQPLDVPTLLANNFIEKIDHLYNKLYDILSTKYSNGQQLKVTFHQDTSHGVHDNSKLSSVLSDEIKNKFKDLINGESQLSITIQKSDDKIVNLEEFNNFINSITFYLTMFNSIALIQEGDDQYGLIASQRELFDADYIFQLGIAGLSITGQQILSEYQSQWNQNDEGRIVWNYGDCWPIYLLNDARDLIRWFNSHFLGSISALR